MSESFLLFHMVFIPYSTLEQFLSCFFSDLQVTLSVRFARPRPKKNLPSGMGPLVPPMCSPFLVPHFAHMHPLQGGMGFAGHSGVSIQVLQRIGRG